MRYSNKRGSARRSGGAEWSEPVKLALAALAVLTLLACWRFGTQPHYALDAASPAAPEDVDAELKDLAITDVDRDVETHGARTLALDMLDGDARITSGDPVILTGSYSGTVYVNAPEETVHLILSGVDITAKTGSALVVEEADRVIITLAEGTKNVLTDAGSYPADTDCDGCIYAVCDLTFNGTGSLEVNGLHQDGIRSTDRVKIVEGSYRVEAKRNAIRGNDGIRVAGGTLFLGSEKNGMMTTKSGADGRGDLVISGGEVSVVAGRYAFVVRKGQLYFLDCRVTTNAVVGDFDIHGTRYIEDGCMS